ncbi:MAG: hypothetical protein V4574_07995 [Pseudomonadota bacterium]
MTALSQSLIRLSILVPFGVAAMALSAPAQAAPEATSPYYGRWTVSEDRPVFTARGRLYKTIDVAPCGRDFCGVSVADDGKCGSVLFRFLGRRANGDGELRGHGKWGADKKTVVIYNASDPEVANGQSIELYLGDGHDFGERSGNMPKFHANYRRLGGARCTTR